MPEDPVLNQGVGGSTSRGLADSAGKVWFPSVVSYAETISPNANVLRPVSQAYPLPTRSVPNTPDTATYVQIVNGTIFLGDGSITDAVCLQPDHTQHHVTAHQDAPWTMQLAAGTEVDLASGAEVIAKQDAPYAVTQSGPWSFTQAAPTPAGANLIGKTVASPDSNFVYVDGVAVPVKYALVSGSASGATPIVPAVTGKRIRVVNFQLSADGTVAVKWQSGSTDITGLTGMSQYVQTGATYCPVGVFQTAVGETLNLNRSAAVYVGGRVVYIEV